jgi:hypothetical protein
MGMLLILAPVLVAVGGVAAVWASSPTSKGWALTATVAIVAAGLWGSMIGWNDWSDRQAQQRSREELQKYVYRDLETATRNLLGLMSSITVAASDGWLPSNEEEFFSTQTERLMCQHLNIEATAPILPERTWLTWITEQTKEAQDKYTALFNAHASVLDDELINALTSVKDSWFLKWPSKRVSLAYEDRQRRFQRLPLLLCVVAENEKEKDLSIYPLRTLYQVLWRRTGSKPYPMPSEIPHSNYENYLKNTLGRSRFTSEDHDRWTSKHEHAPSRRQLQ